MPGASYAKPDNERRNRVPPVFSWTTLPLDGRSGPAPELPEGREWPSATRSAWETMWRKPQATQWDEDGSSLHRWAWLHADLTLGKGGAASLSSEMRQIEDRHGLSPKAMLQLKWRIGTDEATDKAERPKTQRGRRKLRVVDSAVAG